MALFKFGKVYSKEDLQKEITKLQKLFREAIGADATSKSRSELKLEMTIQLNQVLEVIRKGKFIGWEMVEWSVTEASHGHFTSLRNVTPVVQSYLEIM